MGKEFFADLVDHLFDQHKISVIGDPDGDHAARPIARAIGDRVDGAVGDHMQGAVVLADARRAQVDLFNRALLPLSGLQIEEQR